VLQAWRSEFSAENSHEPRLWIDKYCLDQRNVRANLQCLPVFLAGCERLLVVLGETYLGRLWCLVELFVFLQMGASHSQLTVRKMQDGRLSAATIQTFDARNARCFADAERDLLLGMMEASFASLDNFSRAIRRILEDDAMSLWDEAVNLVSVSVAHLGSVGSDSEHETVHVDQVKSGEMSLPKAERERSDDQWDLEAEPRWIPSEL